MALSVARGSFAVLSTDTVGTTGSPSGFGFQPKALIIYAGASGSAADNVTTSQHGRFCLGLVASTTSRVCVLVQHEDNSAAVDSDSMIRTDAICGSLTNAGAISGLVDLQSFDADGFTWIVDDQLAENRNFSFIALGGTDLTDVAVGTFAEPGATGVQAVITGLSFQPDFAALIGSQAAATSTRTDDAQAMLGVTDGTGEWVVAMCDQQADDPSATRSYGRSGECLALMSGTPPATDCRASFSSFDADGLNLNFAERTAAGRLFGYLALQGGSYHVTEVLTQTDTTTDIVVTGAGVGTPRGILVASCGQAEHAADTPAAPGWLIAGAGVSTTDRGSQGTRWNDNVATTEAVGINETDEILAKSTNGAAIEALMDVKSVDADGVTFIMDDADASQSWAGVLLFGDTQSSGVSGSLSSTLAALVLAATATVGIAGASSPTLGALTSSAAGTVAVAGTEASTLGALTSTAAGTVAVQGASAQTLGALTLSASGLVGSTTVSGSLSATLAGLTQSAQGAVAVNGASLPTLDSIASVATATVAVQGQSAIGFGSLTSTATGAVAIQASLTQTLATLTLVASDASGPGDVTATHARVLGGQHEVSKQGGAHQARLLGGVHTVTKGD